MKFVCSEALAPYAKEYFKDSNIEVVVTKYFDVCEENAKGKKIKKRRCK